MLPVFSFLMIATHNIITNNETVQQNISDSALCFSNVFKFKNKDLKIFKIYS